MMFVWLQFGKIIKIILGYWNKLSAVGSLLSRCSKVMRLSSPVGWMFLALPGLWGFIWGRSGDYRVMVWIIAGAIWARSLGCFYNDWVDRTLDAQVSRTRNRPLVSEPPSWGMLTVMGTFFVVGSCVFLVYLPRSCIIIAGMGALGTAVYPWTKRFTHYPQVLLGIIFNLAVWMPACITGQPFSMGLWILYAYGVLWTVSYDTIYAFQDVQEDGPAGIHSLAVKMGPEYGHRVLGILMMVRWCLMIVLAQVSRSPGFGELSGSHYQMISMITIFQGYRWRTLDLSDPKKCGVDFIVSLGEGVELALLLHVLVSP